VPTFADRGCHAVSMTNSYGSILDFLDRVSHPYQTIWNVQCILIFLVWGTRPKTELNNKPSPLNFLLTFILDLLVTFQNILISLLLKLILRAQTKHECVSSSFNPSWFSLACLMAYSRAKLKNNYGKACLASDHSECEACVRIFTCMDFAMGACGSLVVKALGYKPSFRPH
jgi:hypothetical protein